jgi:hypothetical protein
MLVDTSGNVGIGTTSPQASLHVAGDIGNTPTGNGVLMGISTSGASNYGHIQLNGDTGSYIDFSSSGVDRKGRILYNNAANYMQIQTNGSDKVRITSSGNVGIGTTTPNAKLNVLTSGSGVSSLRLDSDSTNDLSFNHYTGYSTLRDNTLSSNRMLFFDSGKINLPYNLGVGLSGATQPSYTLDVQGSAHIAYNSSNENKFIQSNGSIGYGHIIPFNNAGNFEFNAKYTLGDADYVFLVNDSSELLRIKENGNVGIGTTSPNGNASKTTLHINSDTNGAAIRLSQSSNSSLIRYDDTDGLQIGTIASKKLSFETGDTTAITIDTDQNVGIGTTNPTYKLETIGSGYFGGLLRTKNTGDSSEINLIPTGGSPYIQFLRGGSTDWRIKSGGNGSYQILDTSIGGTSVMTVQANGNVGIGTTSPSEKLHVNGIIRTHNSTETKYINVFGGNSGNFIDTYGNSLYLRYGGDSSKAILLDSAGNVGIGTTSPASKLHVQGALLLQVNASDQNSSEDSTTNPSTTTPEFMRIGHTGTYSDGRYTHEWVKLDRVGNLPLYLRQSKGTANSFENIARFGEHSYSTHRFEVFGSIAASGATMTGDILLGDFNKISGVTTDNLVIGVDKNNASGGSSIDFQLDGSTSALFINNSRNVGIGTTSPSRKLHVNAGVDNEAVRIESTDTEVALELKDTTGTATIRSRGDFRFDGSSGEILRMETGGNVGIGTTGPNALLNVQGDSDPTILINAETGNSANSGKLAFAETDGGAHQAWMKYDGSANRLEIGTAQVSQAFVINRTDGNVGIGTTSVGTINGVAFSAVGLHVKASTLGRTITEGSSWGEYIMNHSGASANQRGKFIQSKSGNFNLGSYDDNGTQRVQMTVLNGGNVGIGNANPTAAKLIVRQDSGYAFRTENGSGWTFRVAGDTGNTEVGGNLTVSGDLTVSGTTTTIDTAILRVEDHNIELGNVSSPDSTTADGGGITLLAGSSESDHKTIKWINSTDAWTFSNKVSVPSIIANLSSEGTYFTGGSGSIRQLSITSGTNISAHALHTFNIASSNGKYEFDINGATKLSLDSSSATFAGDLSADNITSTSNAGSASIYINSTRPTLGFTDSNSFTDPNDIYIVRAGGNDLKFQWYDDTASSTTDTFSIDNSGNATFAGNVTVDGGQILTPSGSNLGLNPNTGIVSVGGVIQCSGTGASTFAGNVTATNILTIAGAATGSPYLQFTQGGSQKAYIQYVDSGDSFELQTDNQLVLRTGGSTTALTINSSQNATFAGSVTATSLDINGEANISDHLVVKGTSSLPLSSLFAGSLVVQGAGNEDPIIAVTDINTQNAAAGVFHQSSTSPGFPALVINAASNGSEQPLISARTNVSNTSGIGGTEVFAVDGNGDATFAGSVTATSLIKSGGSSSEFLKADGSVDSNTYSPVAGSTSLTTAGVLTVDQLNMRDAGDYITFYGDDAANHSIGARNASGNADDDIRINSYGSVYINLDSNNNNSSIANFLIGRHGGTGAISDWLFKVDGENGNVGIGTTSFVDTRATGGLHLANATGIAFQSTSSNTNSRAWRIRNDDLADWGSLNFAVGTTNSDFADAATDVVMTMLRSGNVGIGTTTPSVGLQVGNSVSGETKTVIFNSEGGTENGLLIKSRTNRAKLSVADNDTSAYMIAEGSVASFGMADTAAATNISVRSDGDVGIGTTNPDTKLHIALAGGSAQLTLERTGGGAGKAVLAGAAEGFIVYDDVFGPKMYVGTSGTYNGNVGIGTISPSSKLHVAGQIMISPSSGTPSLKFQDSGTTNAYIDLTDGQQRFDFRDDSDTVMSVTLDTLRVGIGTTSPATSLEVNGSIAATGVLNAYTTSGSTQIGFDGTSSFITANAGGGSNANLKFYSGSNAERMVILSNGNVGIGRTSPVSKLHVYQNDAATSTTAGITIEQDGTGDAQLQFLLSSVYRWVQGIDNSDGDKFKIGRGNDWSLGEDITITTSGEVGIGTTSPSAKLEVNGHFAATTKSFIIDNPEKGGRLQYGVVETDEHSVYVRGKSDQNIVELPEEWGWLVDEDSVTVQLTSIGQMQHLFVIKQNNKYIEIGGLAHHGEYNYVVYGTRKDVGPLKKHLK